jgi:hypothetical protein
MLLPVLLLALVGGGAAAVMQHHDRNGRAAPVAGAPLASATAPAGAEPSSSPAGSSGARALAAPAREYSDALDRLAAAQSPADLSQVARRLAGGTSELVRATGRLARAEAAHLDALTRLSALDPTAPAGLGSYARLATTATRTSAAVTKAAAGRDAVPDPSVATGNVVTVVGTAVVDGIGDQVTQIATAAAQADLTAQLRLAAGRAQALLPAASRARAALASDSDTARKAATVMRALQALASLRTIDGDHLASWASIKAPLQQALTMAGIDDAGDDVSAINAMVARAQRKLAAWQAAVEAASSGTGSSNTSGTATTAPSKHAAAAVRAIDSYRAGADALVARYTQAINTLPLVAPGQQPSFELATRFHNTSRLFGTLSADVARLRPPAGMSTAQQALADLVARGRAAAAAGEATAVEAADCNPDTRVCVLGAMPDWPAYKSGVNSLGSSTATTSTIARSAAAAKAAASAQRGTSGSAITPTPATAPAPPKPVV